MGDPYRNEKPQRQQKKQCRQWKDMTEAERRAWVLYFKGQGPKPGANPMKWDD